jgi:O-antigen/teichoic acid export membrane protein
LVLINAIVGFLLIFVKFGYLFKNTPISINFSFTNKNVLKELMSFSFWTTIIGVGQRLLFNISPILLGILSGTSQIVFFSIGNIIEGYTWTIANALNGLFLSKVTHLESKENNLKSITDLMIKVGRMQLTIIGLLLVGLITLGKQFILLWMGEGYEPSYYIVLLLVLPGIITLTQEIAGTYLIVLNKLKIRAIIILLTSVLSVFISFFLAPKYGAIGCAIGIFVANLLGQVVGMNYIYWKVIKLEIPRFFKECYLSMVLPIVITLLVGIAVNYFIPQISIVIFIMKVIIISFIYLMMMWFFGLKTDEKLLFQNGITKLLQKLKLV